MRPHLLFGVILIGCGGPLRGIEVGSCGPLDEPLVWIGLSSTADLECSETFLNNTHAIGTSDLQLVFPSGSPQSMTFAVGQGLSAKACAGGACEDALSGNVYLDVFTDTRIEGRVEVQVPSGQRGGTFTATRCATRATCP